MIDDNTCGACEGKTIIKSTILAFQGEVYVLGSSEIKCPVCGRKKSEDINIRMEKPDKIVVLYD